MVTWRTIAFCDISAETKQTKNGSSSSFLVFAQEKKKLKDCACELVNGWLEVDERVCYRLAPNLRKEDPDTMRQWLHLEKTHFQNLLNLFNLIQKENTYEIISFSAARGLLLGRSADTFF